MKKVLFLGGDCEALHKLRELLPEYQVDVISDTKKLKEDLIGYDVIIAKQSKNGSKYTGMDLLKTIHEHNPNIFRIIPSVLVSQSHKHSMLALCLKWRIGLVESIDQVVPLPRQAIIISHRYNRIQASA